jgi:TRAP-type C4-dicarboxylate transport system substrate-binding protein
MKFTPTWKLAVKYIRLIVDGNTASRIHGSKRRAPRGFPMLRALTTMLAVAGALLSGSAFSEPIRLKLSYFSSDRTMLYLGGVKPFVDAVNAEATGLLEIEVYFSGALGKSPAQQPQLVRDGLAQLAYIIPGYTADQFPDNAVIELPGLYRNQSEASLVFTRLIAANALRGYEDFVVNNAFAAEPHSIHTRKPVTSLADLKGLTIRVNNPTEAATFEKLGMRAIIMPVNQISDAISSGRIDGAAVPPAMLSEFGVGRLTGYHYMIHADAPSLALVMSRKTFVSLPARAQDIVRKYSGEWAVARSNEFFEAINAKSMEQLKSDPKRSVIFPSPADRIRIQAAFKEVIHDWEAKSPRNHELLEMAKAEIEKLRCEPTSDGRSGENRC